MDISMEFSRGAYVSQLVSQIGSGQVKVVTGVRRCGKTYLLNTLFKRHLIEAGIRADHIVEMDFDGYRNSVYRDPDRFLSFIDGRITDGEPYFLLLDEIQLLDRFPEVLNDLLRMENVDVYATGSNARLLSKDVVTEFRGRGYEIPMRPLSFSEFMEGFNGDKRDGYLEYATYGGLPAVVLRKSADEKTQYLTSVMSEVYLADIVDRYKVRDVSDLNDLVDMLSSCIGSLVNPTKIANTFKSEKHSNIARETVDRFLAHLEDSFLFEKAVRYDIKGRKYIGAGSKYYAVDVGLRNARLNFRQFEETHIMENILYNELRGRGFKVDVGIVPSQRRDSQGSVRRVNYEIDFVCNLGSKRLYIQSAYALPTQEKMDQEQASLMRVGDSFKKVIVTKDGIAPHYNDRGVLIMNIYDFLLHPSSLEI